MNTVTDRMRQVEVKDRLMQLRSAMQASGLDAYLIYARDPHQSECSLPHWNTRKWISGFTGSAGMLVVSMDRAGLWTDSRYVLQARRELEGSSIDLHITGLPESQSPSDFVKNELSAEARVGVDGRVLSVRDRERMQESLAQSGIELDIAADLIEPLWKDRPRLPRGEIFPHPLEFSGQSRRDKLQALRSEMKKKQVDHYIVSALDGVAWLFNIRGHDGVNLFVAIAYGLVRDDGAILFIDPAKVPADLRAELERDGVELLGYDELADHLSRLPKAASVGFDPAQLNCILHSAIPDGCRLDQAGSLVDVLKCRKNSVELSNLADVHVKDGLAVVKFMAWLEDRVKSDRVTELTAQERLARFRQEAPDMLGPSFDTIAGYAQHGALPHYHASSASDLPIMREGFLLVDSGGHYQGGTTDITRTMACGPLTEDMLRDYTLVLKGLVNLSRQRFLRGVAGANLDVLARAELWRYGLDFKHGTGHGVGNLLNVHEGPCGISLKSRAELEPGMVLTIEPGIYRAGEYGIRLENIVVVAEDGESEFGRFCRFDTLTLAPFDRRAIDTGLLSGDEIEWLDRYHERVYRELAARLDPQQADWLRRMTAPLSWIEK